MAGSQTLEVRLGRLQQGLRRGTRWWLWHQWPFGLWALAFLQQPPKCLCCCIQRSYILGGELWLKRRPLPTWLAAAGLLNRSSIGKTKVHHVDHGSVAERFAVALLGLVLPGLASDDGLEVAAMGADHGMSTHPLTGKSAVSVMSEGLLSSPSVLGVSVSPLFSQPKTGSGQRFRI